MNSTDLRGKPGHLIRRAQQIAVAIFMEETASFNITPVQYAALVGIRDNDDIDVSRLSTIIALDRSNLGAVVERLEARGWIRRNASAQDRRAKRLEVTAAGRRLLSAVEPAVVRAQERMLAPLPSQERKHFMHLLELFTETHADDSRVPVARVPAKMIRGGHA
jgi:DNA-binding MarR family transcriptional regulator